MQSHSRRARASLILLHTFIYICHFRLSFGRCCSGRDLSRSWTTTSTLRSIFTTKNGKSFPCPFVSKRRSCSIRTVELHIHMVMANTNRSMFHISARRSAILFLFLCSLRRTSGDHIVVSNTFGHSFRVGFGRQNYIRGRGWRMRWGDDDDNDNGEIGPIKCKIQLAEVNEIKLNAEKGSPAKTEARQTKTVWMVWSAFAFQYHRHIQHACNDFFSRRPVAPWLFAATCKFQFCFFFSLAADSSSSLHTLFISFNLWRSSDVAESGIWLIASQRSHICSLTVLAAANAAALVNFETIIEELFCKYWLWPRHHSPCTLTHTHTATATHQISRVRRKINEKEINTNASKKYRSFVWRNEENWEYTICKLQWKQPASQCKSHHFFYFLFSLLRLWVEHEGRNEQTKCV